MQFEQKKTPQVVTPSGVVKGYAAVFGTADQGNDVIMPGAFAKCLRNKAPGDIRMLYQHDAKEVIGVWQHLQENVHGLYAQGQLITDVVRGAEVAALLQHRAIDGLSIGFKATRSRTLPRSGIRELLEVEIWEISVVTFPLHLGARVSKAQPLMQPSVYEVRDDDDHMRRHVLRLSTALTRATQESRLRALALKARLDEEEKRNYNPAQPRDPAGTPTGGQWTSGGIPIPKPRPEDSARDQAPMPKPRPAQAGDDVTGNNPGQRVIQDASNNPSFPPSKMTLSDKGTRYLSNYEELRLDKHRDAVGKLTIGYGHRILAGESFPNEITSEEALRIYKDDVVKHMLPVQRYTKINLTQNQFDALTSFAFNAGTEGYRTSTLLKLLNQGDFNGAAQEFPKWVWGDGEDGKKVKVDGLVNRRRDDLNIFLYGIYNIKK